MARIKAAKLRENAVYPTRKHPDDAGMDFYACEEKVIPPHGVDIVRTGITIEIPEGYVGLLRLKSRSDYLLGAGVVDAGYQGEILIKIFNPLETPLHITEGQAIAQMLLIPVITPEIEPCSLSEIHQTVSSRGNSGGIVSQLNQKHM